MRIGELSRRTGVSASRLRFYERKRVLQKPDRGGNGYREYPDSAVKLLSLVDGAQRLGFTLGEIREGLSRSAPDLPSHAALAEALRSKLSAIDQHLRDVRARKREITRLIAELSHDGAAETSS